MTGQRGYTLIEVLVASAMFVGVMVIGVSSFSSVNRVNEQIETTRKLTQTGTFVMETLARDIRTATGYAVPPSRSLTSKPFAFVAVNGQQGILVQTCPDGGCKTAADVVAKTYAWQRGQQRAADGTLLAGQQTLLPADVAMTDFSVTGKDFTTLTIQPYATIEFTVADKDCLLAGRTDCAKQTFRTTVTSLVYDR